MPKPNDPIFEPLHMGRHPMPGVWRYLFPEDFQWLKLPDERHATCDDCYKAKRGDFRDDCRCCTYFPELGNFLLGLALKSDARDAVLPLVKQRYVLPFGLTPTPLRYRRAIAAYAEDRFGTDPDMVCPFVEPSTFHCRIYPFRNSVCSSFFCTNDHGEIGDEFWGRVQDLIGHAESAVAQWCMNEIGLPYKTYVECLDDLAADIPAMFDAESLAWSEKAYSALWGAWRGKEIEFLEACGQLVMEHRGNLFDISRAQEGRYALVYEKNLREFIPEKHRNDAPRAAVKNSVHRPIDSNLYKLQLIERQLWELPFHGGPVGLSHAVEIVDNPRDDAWSKSAAEPFMVRSRNTADTPEIRELFGAAEIDLLRILKTPQKLGEKFFARPELDKLENPRGFLAQCLRLGILREEKTPPR